MKAKKAKPMSSERLTESILGGTDGSGVFESLLGLNSCA
jgi:hypothetical protein